ncbi:OmpA family protein [Hymenobacter sp. HSC-4F20]|uniref:OmpA family protein n=1 Tax=Hymenobacter sp. HSC-4F20 TaxID=2864135 RepID=UPI001C72D72D|nr:OmpA family protein [Hymenobacter sp. HSC-4F20]MBX0289100.1 OmpA family protein [Hymenobacter sp. HSC-4F20]
MSQEQTLEALVQATLTETALTALSAAVQAEAQVVQLAAVQVVKLIIPAFAARSQQPAGTEALWSWLERAPMPDWPAVLGTSEAFFWRGRGTALLEALLGPAYTSRTAFILQVSGLPKNAMPLLVDVVVATTVGVLREQAAIRQLNAEGISRWLQKQPGALPQLPPPEKGSLPGPEPVPAAPPGPANATQKKPLPTFRRAWQALRSSKPWAQYGPLLLLLPALAFGFGIGRLHSSAARRPASFAQVSSPSPRPALAPEAGVAGKVPVTTATYVATAVAASSPAPLASYAAGPDIYLDYPGQPVLLLLGDGTSQRVATRSTEYQLYRLLAGAGQQAESLSHSTRWIPVDQAYFQAGQATLPAAARQQLQNLANILRAFPRARFQIKGYSDSLDGYQPASRLSESRAWTAVKTLREFGIARNRLQVRASDVRPELTSATDEAGNVYQPYLSLQFVGNLPAGVIVPSASSTHLSSTQRAATAARLPSSRSAAAKARRAAQLRRLRAKKQHRAKTRLWFRRLGQRLRGQRASR